MVRKLIIRAFLAALNSRFLNHTPCQYEFVGNIDAFSRADIECTLIGEPEMKLREYIELANRFKSCPIGKGLTVLEADGSSHEATVWDRHELNLALYPEKK